VAASSSNPASRSSSARRGGVSIRCPFAIHNQSTMSLNSKPAGRFNSGRSALPARLFLDGKECSTSQARCPGIQPFMMITKTRCLRTCWPTVRISWRHGFRPGRSASFSIGGRAPAQIRRISRAVPQRGCTLSPPVDA